MINLASYAKALKPDVDDWFGGSYRDKPTQYTEIFDVKDSSQNFEEIVNHYGFGMALVKNQGQTIDYDDAAQGGLIRFFHVTYGLGFIITREAVEDNLYMQIAQQRSKMLAKSMMQTKENVAAMVLNRAFNNSYAGFDGASLISTSHVLQKTQGAAANRLAIDADLSEASLQQAYILADDLRDDANLRIQVMPRKLIVPKEQRFVADVLLGTEYEVDTANNNINTIRSVGIVPEGYRVNNYLTDSDAWFLLTDQDLGLLMYQRRAMEMDSDTADFDTENMKFKATERYSVGFVDWRCIIGSQGA